MKVVIAGGSGHVGAVLIRHFANQGDELLVLSRNPTTRDRTRAAEWDGKTLGPWAAELDGADVVINLAGRSVNCRYNAQNLKEMMDSRVESTRVIGEAIAQAKNPPQVWLQASTATIYSHRYDAANDEIDGMIGRDQAGTSVKWKKSTDIALSWEAALNEAPTPNTRKVAMRSAMTMSIDKGSVFDVLCGLARKGLGGKLGSGKQYVSWIHERDFARSVQFLIDNSELSGAVNLCSPYPLQQASFAKLIREAVGAKMALPTPAWLVAIGTLLMRTESELVLKSRRVVPKRLLDAGFKFEHPEWREAVHELVGRVK